jgi:LEA14-like dessication related protein
MELMKIRLYLLLSILALCIACAPHQVKGQPPFIAIASLSMQENSLSARLDIRNINDVELDIDAIDIKLRVRDVELTHYVSDFKLTVDPNTTEEVSLEKLPDINARQQLTELESGDVSSLPFSLEGRVHTTRDGYLPFKNQGHLYPVPGRPGQFRSASSRTREQR